MSLTAQQAQQLQAIAAQVEVSWREISKSRTALSYLIQAGRATCTDIKTYNLIAKASHYYQRSMADTIRAAGGQAPEVHPPVYIAYRGKSGDDAVNWDCSSGALAGCVPDGGGDYFVNASVAEWRSGMLPSDVQAIQQTIGRVSFADKPGDLGNPVAAIIAIVIVGIVVSVVGYIALKIVEVLGDLPQKVEYTKQMAITSERHRATMEARAKCLADCQAQGKDAIACSKACAKVFPDYKAPGSSGGFGILGWVLGVTLVGGLAYLGWRAWHGPMLHGGGEDDGDGYDGDDGSEADDDNVIDAEFMERIA